MSKYQLVQTESLLRELENYIKPDTIKLTRKNNSTVHRVSAELRVGNVEISKDKCAPTIHIVNSYQGECKLAVHFGLIRFICSNGLVIGSDIWSASAKHIQGPKITNMLDTLADTVKIGVQDLDTRVLPQVALLAEKEMDRTKVEWVLDELKVGAGVYNRALHAFENPWRREDQGSDAWRVYNRIQEIVADSRRGLIGQKQNMDLMNLILAA